MPGYGNKWLSEDKGNTKRHCHKILATPTHTKIIQKGIWGVGCVGRGGGVTSPHGEYYHPVRYTTSLKYS